MEIRKDLIEADCGSVVFCPRMAAHALATPIINFNRSSVPFIHFWLPRCLVTSVISDVKFLDVLPSAVAPKTEQPLVL